ncbi:ornithine cyclodeaminase family protein [Parahaliea mediterranea]|uniref:Ornithine cyclodeaminase family protein n=1 Tax=Parahaliea mediterranea TaxID=651086 RepID=A0A939II91_9GAMM|nr:ornithine cyclodeaminase family protein [Parahaliea mediterranea]MBN7796349.1 ornithine cyclodeaminase family protein [Parahaliea mediterranea]
MIVLNKRHLDAILDTDTLIGLMAEAMRQVSNGGAIQPLRWGMTMPTGGMMGMMPGYIAEPECFGIKVVNMMPANVGTDFSSHSGCLLLFDSEHGQALALLDAGRITARRTAAASALATDRLAREDAAVLTIVGSGEQALAHVEALCAVRAFREVRVCFRNPGRAPDFLDALPEALRPRLRAFGSVAEGVAGADVVCAVTASPTPVLEAAMLEPGMHINLVGACTRDRQEIANDALPGCRYFVDARASARDQAGELHSAIAAGVIDENFPLGEIGEVLGGGLAGRTGAGDITIYRSLGVAAQDLVVADYAYRQARHSSLGQEVAF